MKVVAGIKYNNSVCWLWSDEDLWFLDLNKIDTTLISENAVELRKNFKILNKSNILSFLGQNKDLIVPVEALSKDFEREDKNLYPALFIDFDNGVFYDNFPEPNNYRAALSDEWTYSYEDLDMVVEEKERYWKNH